ncbi:MAG: beta-galactosidase [Prevotellaceae bacterium]|jgi:beta-galactosidase/beta-glucuronidase|nr:beta-galactosidase [Prevotellaceae bacterium]
MKKSILLAGILLCTIAASAQWKPAGDKIKTRWAEQIDPQNVLPEYPRPIMERTEWKNLNGLWNFAIAPIKQTEPTAYNEKILVPFPVESSLSGVQKAVSDTQELWYNRTFTIPSAWRNKRIILHFGAVDWKTEVFVNDVLIGSHTGGYTPFSFDITPFLKSGEQKLVVKVWDPTDKYYQPRGKQVSEPQNIVYTAVSGIWQTVWIEPVNNTHIASLKTLPDIDKSAVSITVNTENATPYDYVEVILSDGEKTVSTKAVVSENIEIKIPDAKLWSPDAPFLYDVEVRLFSNGKLTDKVKSYCAMRKISTKRDKNGIVRLQLNNKNLYHFGLLDQGWWPDGLYTAPTDEALTFDIIKTKEFGYNMIRKHIKVEPARWYTHCDRLGVLVWQDMPSGDNHWQAARSLYRDSNVEHPSVPQANYLKEWKEIIDELYSYPCIVMWIPFNEGWGQFSTKEVAEWTKSYDPSRILNSATGGHFYHVGDVLDLHNYPAPDMFLYDAARTNVLGEYGGIGFVVKEHLWQPDENFGYVEFKTAKETTDTYIEYVNILKSLTGFSGAVYTQTTDVEREVNGVMTYDRAVIKFEEDRLRKANQDLCRSLDE